MRIIAIACLVALLAACGAGDSYVVRSRVDGQWQVDARARVDAGVATFECLHSASGSCHYTLLGLGCGGASSGSASCSAEVLKQFSLAVDTRKAWRGLPGFRLCVSHRPDAARPHCSGRGEAARASRG